ncbi:hypothetical protein [Devosia lacusdianchii]|uniref:hypothetical protein n=1 Tax=Devosia lacusdianchii TaxID=2917991 RepID=UPI001F05FA35|nr:hypothetical protein [Devosia sp. JXJ CY 41]
MAPIVELLGARYGDLPKMRQLAGLSLQLEVIGDQSYVSLPEAGISLVLPDGVMVSAVQVHGSTSGFSQFAGELPHGIDFSMGREHARALLGDPDSEGEARNLPLLGLKPAWDSFLMDGYRLHLEYTIDTTSIQLVSIMPR